MLKFSTTSFFICKCDQYLIYLIISHARARFCDKKEGVIFSICNLEFSIGEGDLTTVGNVVSFDVEDF
jgi:hypothetical protein